MNVSIEVTPQHLYFDLEHLEETRYKSFQMNPPIRHQNDREALKTALRNGEIQYLATDHAPHTTEEKEKGTSGLTGLDTYAGFVTWLLSEGFSPELMAKVCAENPGDFHNQFLDSWNLLDQQKSNQGLGVGYLKPGYLANFTILQTNHPSTITVDKLKTKVLNFGF